MKGILAILMAGIMIAAMIAPAMSEDANTSASVGNDVPDVSLVSVSPDPVTMAPCPATTSITVTATVSDANGVGDIASVEITDVSPAITGVSVPISMAKDHDNSATEAVYTATINLPCCTPATDYTATVTATDSAPSSGTGTDTFTVDPTVAITVTNVAFGSVAPGGNSTASSTVTCTGNAGVEFVDADSNGYDVTTSDGIIWSEMTSGSDVIADNQISTAWASTTTIICGGNDAASFTLDVPSGTPEGAYGGTITFTPTAV